MNIHFAAPITHRTSYGICALNLTEQFNNNTDINLSIHPIGGGFSYDPAFPEQDLSHLHNKELDGEIVSIVLFHQGMMSQYHHPKATHRIGFPIFELDGFTQKELEDLQFQDEIIVCSQWAKFIIERYFPDKPIHVVPLGYNTKLYQFVENHPNQYEPSTIFLNIGKWEHRKCHTELANVFRKAFAPHDKVKLLMCPTNFWIGEQENNRLINEYKSILGDQVHFYGRFDSQVELANIQNLCDAAFQPSRSEGFGLPAFESLVLGKHLIATNYGGYSEFVDDANAHVVKITQLEKAYDGFWFNGQFNWAHIGPDQINQMVEHLRFIHTSVQNKGHKNYSNVHDSVSHMTWAYSSRKLIEGIYDRV